MAKRSLRNSFLWVHRWLGLISGLVVFVVALTGCIYVFEEELRDVFQSKYFYVHVPENGQRKPLNEISAVVKQQFPSDTVTQVRFREQANAAIIFHTRSRKAISVDPYSLQVAGVRDLDNDFFDWILDLHRHLLMGDTGNQIVKWNVLIFFILCISGLIVWWPKQKRFLKQAITIKFKTKNTKRLNWDLHSVLGFYSLAVLLIISLTGMFWMFDSVKWMVRKVTNAPVVKNEKLRSKPIPDARFTVEEAYVQATAMHPGATHVFITTNPTDSTAPLRVLFRYPYSLVRKQNTLFFDKYSGKILKEDLYKNYTAYDKVARSNYDLHTGRIHVLGIGSKIIYFLASLFAASLPVTGFVIWYGRRKKKKIPTPVGRKTDVAKPVLQPELLNVSELA
jgi:uncharacterized iron-regulated membrane protein